MTTLTHCKADGCTYTLWLRYADGVAGTAYLDNLVEHELFEALREPGCFANVRIESNCVVWPALRGALALPICIDGELFYRDLIARGARPAAAPARAAPRAGGLRGARTEAAFRLFMVRALAPIKRRRRGAR